MNQRDFYLICSILIDLIGFFSYLLPGIGESFDLIWAPISASLLQLMYGSWLFSIGNLIEEILPGIDFIPTALFAWYYVYGRQNQQNHLHNQ